MKKTVILMMGAVMVAGTVLAADVSLSVDFASAYVFRGVTLNDGFVMQPGAEISGFPIPEEYGSITLGTWANYDIDDYNGALEEGEVSEIDYYITYSLPVEGVDIDLSYLEYTYPNGGADSDREIAFSLGKELGTNGLYSSITANYGVGGAVDESWYIEAALDCGMDLSDALSASARATLGYLIADEGEEGFNDATVSLGLSYALSETWSVNGSVTYIAQLDDEVLADEVYDVDLVGVLGLSCAF